MWSVSNHLGPLFLAMPLHRLQSFDDELRISEMLLEPDASKRLSLALYKKAVQDFYDVEKKFWKQKINERGELIEETLIYTQTELLAVLTEGCFYPGRAARCFFTHIRRTCMPTENVSTTTYSAELLTSRFQPTVFYVSMYRYISTFAGLIHEVIQSLCFNVFIRWK